MRRDIAVAKLNALGRRRPARPRAVRLPPDPSSLPLSGGGSGWGSANSNGAADLASRASRDPPPTLPLSGEGAAAACRRGSDRLLLRAALCSPATRPKVPFDQILRADVQRAHRGPRDPGGAVLHPGGSRVGADRRAEPRRPGVFRIHSRALRRLAARPGDVSPAGTGQKSGPSSPTPSCMPTSCMSR